MRCCFFSDNDGVVCVCGVVVLWRVWWLLLEDGANLFEAKISTVTKKKWIHRGPCIMIKKSNIR